ncbi:hypothetical protein GA0061099_10145 [Bradyrhizobium yuanmingense]|uniref:Uncharacterized protein n=1 Tax=Bradyrhizobium yuanmingense TaxID=108015 RepID=A0A1C3XFP4_9BRAD|nr:hypothetical protein IQ15_06809 [Bradyrhizobium yuanmingense]SCB50916.1 hypothetical protein GA0061099_10145 [Bradyrhizobium yuanmingense]
MRFVVIHEGKSETDRSLPHTPVPAAAPQQFGVQRNGPRNNRTLEHGFATGFSRVERDAVDLPELDSCGRQAVSDRVAGRLVGVLDTVETLLFESSNCAAILHKNRSAIVNKCIRQLRRAFMDSVKVTTQSRAQHPVLHRHDGKANCRPTELTCTVTLRRCAGQTAQHEFARSVSATSDRRSEIGCWRPMQMDRTGGHRAGSIAAS